jgi:chlorophyllase
MPTTVYAPRSGGPYPVVLFEHGLVVDHNLYSEILTQLASHGFVAVAPQTYRPGTLPIGIPSMDEEIGRVRTVLEWADGNLSRVTGVTADLSALAIGGHSRGGPVAWLLAREQPDRFKAVIGVDPVDGAGGVFGPPTLVGAFDSGIPALIVAAGMGDVPTAIAGTPCAPDGHNYVQFFEATSPPVWQVIVPTAGHLDVFDYCEGYPYCQLCTHGADPAGMRRLTAGLMVGFLRATLQRESSGYAYLSDTSAGPLPFELTQK